MSTTRFAVLAFFAFLAASPKLVEPAYVGYLACFAALLAAVGPRLLGSMRRQVEHGIAADAASTVLLLLACIASWHWIVAPAAARDVLRDVGAIGSLAIGRWVLPKAIGDRPEAMLRILSDVGLGVGAATLVGAALAYVAGATAYHWRGEFVIMAANWLPYCLVANLALTGACPEQRSALSRRSAFIVVAILASLSRTDALLLLLIGVARLAARIRNIVSRPSSLARLLAALIAATALLPLALQLDVVQQRLEAGLDDDDPSLGWRFIENLTMLDHLDHAGAQALVFGEGLGARLPLPPGIEDFDGNDSIPLLHNSYLTIVLKFGLLGWVPLVIVAGRALRRSWRSRRDPMRRAWGEAGGWIVTLVLVKALTLQALSEWSHLMFFGCALWLTSVAATPVRRTRALVERTATR